MLKFHEFLAQMNEGATLETEMLKYIDSGDISSIKKYLEELIKRTAEQISEVDEDKKGLLNKIKNIKISLG